MCGITGFWKFSQNKIENEEKIIQSMTQTLAQRGPDSSGIWYNKNQGIYLGHTRLAIRDLAPTGAQPMVSQSGRLVLIYNGEIYNSLEIKNELEGKGVQFRGTSDTEVLLEALDVWGMTKTCERIIGMFAFAVWDEQEKHLILARDRLGIKPLYWGFQNDTLFFGSELKSFFPHPHFKPSLNHDILSTYFRLNYVPNFSGIYKEIHKLTPGSYVTIKGYHHHACTKFWELKNHISIDSRILSDKDAIDELEQLLSDAVKKRMITDVPLGAFLSGGIDSSLIVALMQSQSKTPIQTFTIGFEDNNYNEAPEAKKIAHYLNTHHHELYVNSKDLADIIPSLPHIYDEPFADVSQLPTLLVSKLARQHVKVVLSGDGGDEIFGGYHRYQLLSKIQLMQRLLPQSIRHALSKGMTHWSPSAWDSFFHPLQKFISLKQLGYKIHKLAKMLNTEDVQDFYKKAISVNDNPSELLVNGVETWGDTWQEESALKLQGFSRLMYLDTLMYLPDDILTKVDRASMSVGLEARVPLLDHRVVEYAWGLPQNMKIRGHTGKWIIREILKKHVPKSYWHRAKMGFGVPLDSWLRGPLKEWAQDLLSADSLKRAGILRPAPVQHMLNQHLKGEGNWQYALWGLLMFESWRLHWKIAC